MYGITCTCCEHLMEVPKLHWPIIFGDVKGLQRFLMDSKIEFSGEGEEFDESRIVELQIRYQVEVEEK